MTRFIFDDPSDLDDVDTYEPIRPRSRSTTKQAGGKRRPRPGDSRRAALEEFKCGHCRTFVGPPLSGGRHRNHCPLCLYSRHVDDRRPGDRASACRSLMAPVATYHRRNGEQVIVHRCLGCDVERHCRVAADDHILTCLRLPLAAAAPVAIEGEVAFDEAIA